MSRSYCVRNGRLVPCEVIDVNKGLARISVSEEVNIALGDLYDPTSLPEFRRNVCEQIQELKKLLSDIDQHIARNQSTKGCQGKSLRVVVVGERPDTSTDMFGGE